MPLASTTDTAALIPGARVEIVARAGHFPVARAPGRTSGRSSKRSSPSTRARSSRTRSSTTSPSRRAAFEAVEDEVEPERELVVVVAAPEAALVAGRHGDRRDVRVALASWAANAAAVSGSGTPEIVEEVLVEAEDAAAEDVHRVMGQVDREAAIADDPDDGLHVGERRRPGRTSRLDDRGRPTGGESMHREREDRRAGASSASRGPLTSTGISPTTASTIPSRRSSLLADVRVQRHRLDAELLAEPAHADGVDAVPIGERRRQPRGREPWSAALRRSSLSSCRSIAQSILLTSLRRMDYLVHLTAYGRPRALSHEGDRDDKPATDQVEADARPGRASRSTVSAAPLVRPDSLGRPPRASIG